MTVGRFDSGMTVRKVRFWNDGGKIRFWNSQFRHSSLPQTLSFVIPACLHPIAVIPACLRPIAVIPACLYPIAVIPACRRQVGIQRQSIGAGFQKSRYARFWNDGEEDLIL
jgi:hypothetical protein